MSNETLLEVKHLKKYFKVRKGLLHAVDDLSFHINRSETLGLVGESGCGKSTTGRAIIRLIEPDSGEVLLAGQDIRKLNKQQLKEFRQNMQMVFQDPYSSLNPRLSIFDLIAEPLMNIPEFAHDKKKVYDTLKQLRVKLMALMPGGR